MQVELDGKQYYAEQEQGHVSCEGCVFNESSSDGFTFCNCSDSELVDTCYVQQVVWKEVKAPMFKKIADEKPKFTVEQVLLAAGEYLRTASVYEAYDKLHPEAVAFITEDLMKHDDPDYQLYLELKYKYENKTW